MRVLTQIVFRLNIKVCEVTAPATGNTDFLARGLGVVDDQRPLTRLDGAHHAGGSGPKDQRVDLHGRQVARPSAYRKGIGRQNFGQLRGAVFQSASDVLQIGQYAFAKKRRHECTKGPLARYGVYERNNRYVAGPYV